MWRADRVESVASEVALRRGEGSGDIPPVYPFELAPELRRVRELSSDNVRFRGSTSSPAVSVGASRASVVGGVPDSEAWTDSVDRDAGAGRGWEMMLEDACLCCDSSARRRSST